MKKLFILLISLSVLSGCGIFKQRTVDKKTSSFSQSSELNLKADSTVKKRDKTVTIERASADTTVRTPEKKISTSTDFTMSDLKDGLNVITDTLLSVRISLDSATGKIKTEATVKPRDVNFKFDKSKTTLNDLTEETSKSSTQNNKEATEAKNTSKSTEAKPKGLFWFWAAIVGAVIAVVGLIVWIVRRYFPKAKNPV